ncbi:uncharacterized protein MONOS_4926 [Monocercomonoides exilis]|uniref:uncharacterized protein n=1 Tax=Monocercomonoides exilis TaxID=2049356 RepID=UPI0035595DED|nr:hypothetical protein MONOS_4926 [Monocercomonoides exilis]|eukprot:MONOS_4926.1-p1 / transcript=MONOS_4926.1 / gene=MONOS_4926 / organism=Monocercomonoides_exilis_PA203 / gene_product=unspecified product / transcript_product=unspecified product / location=Mono_scaffold00138:15776-24828(+) / protein_length=2705 / sequence_SO=supercontig / SO=protein_coding / is_pseudo=false
MNSENSFLKGDNGDIAGNKEMQRIEVNETSSFTDCEWKNANHSSINSAGVVLRGEGNSVTILRCSFAYLDSYYHTCVDSQNTAFTNVTDSNSSSCHAVHNTPAILIYKITMGYYVKGCRFEKCSSSTIYAGAIRCEPTTITSEEIIQDNYFESNEAATFGGGTYIPTSTNHLIISNNLYVRNKAHGTQTNDGGGGIIIFSQPWMSSESNRVFIYFCFFCENLADNLRGNDCYFTGNSLVQSPFESSFSTTDSNRIFYNNQLTEYDNWLATWKGTIRFVSSLGTDISPVCGLIESNPCTTLESAVNHTLPLNNWKVKLIDSLLITRGVNIGDYHLNICGSEETSSVVQTSFLNQKETCLFCVSMGVLSISNFDIVHNSIDPNNRDSRLFEISGAGGMSISRLNIFFGSGQSAETAFITELINVQNGMFQMEHVNWAKTISTVSLFSLSSTNEIALTLSECSFDGIERTTSGAAVMSFLNDKANIDVNSSTFEGCGSSSSENGGSIMLCVGNENEVKLKGGSFDGCFCSATYGFGGGILLRLLNENPNFLISSSFSTNTAKWGNDIFVISPNLEETAKSENIRCVTVSLDSVDRVRGYDNGNTGVAIPLCIYLLPTPEEISVSNVEASDHSHCGIVQFPCLTMKHSLKRQTGTKKVVVNGMIMMSDELAFGEQKHEIQGKDGQSGWTVSDSNSTSNSAMISASAETELSKLIFSLPSSLPLRSTFISSSSSISLIQCSLSLQNPSSELSLQFLSIDSGILIIDMFSASSMILSGYPFISLFGDNTEAKLKSIQLNGIGTSYASGFIEVKNKASLQMSDSDVSSIATSEGIASSRLISSTSAKKIEIIRTDISNFAVKEENGGAIECTLESGCSFVFEEGSMSLCKSERGNGGGLWMNMKSGSSFSVGNITEDPPNNGNVGEQGTKVGFSECEATANADGKKGMGGAIYFVLDDKASDFILNSIQFNGCKGRKGKDVFLDADDLSAVIDSAIFGFGVNLNELEKLNGFERSTANDEFEIPLVVYLWNNFTAPCHVGGQEAHDFSGCGFEQVPCITITKAASLRFSGKNKSIKLNSPFSFGEELKMDSNEWSVSGEGNTSNHEIGAGISGSQRGVFETRCPTTFGKVVFSVAERIRSYESIFHCISNKVIIQDCGIIASENSLDISFVKIEEGEVMISNVFGIGIKWQTSAIICDGNSGGLSSVEIVESNFSGSGEQNECLVECCNEQKLNITKCQMKSFARTSGNAGCLNIDNNQDERTNTQINIEECIFDGCSVYEKGSRGGAINVQLKGNTHLDIISCTFTGCTTPAEEEKTGFGGGMAMKVVDDEISFVISSPVFEAGKPNVARYGNDLFVESSNLTKSITNDSLPFVSDHLADLSFDSMRGFDGSDTTNAIPLVYFWLTFCSEVFICSEGRDMGACGYSDYPCLSIDYSLTRLSEGNERNVNIIGKGYLQKSVDVSGISVKSDNSSMCSLESASSLEGAEGAALKIQGNTNFELINFVIPSSFMSGVNYLIYVGSNDGLLTAKDCSFSKNEESRREIMNYGLIKAEGGTIVLEFVKVQSLSFSKDIVSVLSSTILKIKNLTMKDVQLDGTSGLSISKSSRRETNEVEQDVVIEWSIFEEVTQNTTDDIPIIRNDNDDEPLKMVIRNTTMKRCGGLKCGKGGGMFYVLNEGGSFDCSFCTISECFCSTIGRGGWLFLECTSTDEKPLNFMLSNITFKDNSALRGRDVYIRCNSVDTQIVDEQFLLDFRTPFVKERAIWGCTTDSFVGEEDLLLKVVKYQSETIFVSSATGNHGDSKQCGEFSMPCNSLNMGVQHVIPSLFSQLLILGQTVIIGKCDVHDVIIRSLQSPSAALVHLNSTITNDGSLITTSENVRIERLKFSFDLLFSYSGISIIHEASGQLSLSSVDFSSVGQSDNIESIVLNLSLLSVENGIFHIDNCSVSFLSFKKPSFLLNCDEINITNVKLEQIESTTDVFEIGDCGSVVFYGVSADGVKLSEGCIIAINDLSSGTVSIGISSFNNCSRNSKGASVLSASSTSAQVILSNCSCSNCDSLSVKGSIMEISNAKDVSMQTCEFEGILSKVSESERNNNFEEICKWNGSLVHSANSSLVMKDVIISNSSSGGFSVSAGDVTIEKGEFLNNNPFIEKYPSFRRNVICSDSASLIISSLKGGDGLNDNSSLWILNDGCTLEGFAGERPSPFFIPKLEDVSVNENESNVVVKFKGSLFVPCDLSFRLIFKTGDVELAETYRFEEDSFVSETEVIGRISSENITAIADETEVTVMILFGKQLAETSPQILKNKTEPKTGNEKVVEGGKEGKSYWPLIVIIMAIILLIVLIVSVILARIKKRVYEKSLGHSESSEHLLSESGSTEYILGKDSDKIPDWTLEKEEEEEVRKRTPSPSISSTSTTDSDSTFVRGEDLCPTTSSMSNLVDAMACSSPHEKLIVDLRDSLFMLLHGSNKTKEMPIGSLKEREQTAAQILFWVANLALHSFDEMENKLQSLSSLSPHIVLFSEHMVICIVMHSDFLSSDDSDSSSISSLTVVTSASDDDDVSLPSSAFEDDDDIRKESLRWMAPELLMNRKMGATKESVAFSIGMMLWECVTLEIPFGEYEGVVAGQKIVNGERPNFERISTSSLQYVTKCCLSGCASQRPTLALLKRELIQRFPPGAAVLTMTDAVECYSGCCGESERPRDSESRSEQENMSFL